MVHKITVSSYCRNKNATHRVKSLHSHLHGKEQLTPFQWIHHWFIVTHIKTIGSLSSISKQLSSNGFTTASTSQAIKWTHTLVYCHPYQNNWFIVIHIKTISQESPAKLLEFSVSLLAVFLTFQRTSNSHSSIQGGEHRNVLYKLLHFLQCMH
jgi:hypothetical protein